MTTMRIGGGERVYDDGIDRLARDCAAQPTPEERFFQFEFSRDGDGEHFTSSEYHFASSEYYFTSSEYYFTGSECHFASSELKFGTAGTWL